MDMATRTAAGLPPGQRAIDGFPRFGTHLHRPPPALGTDPAIEITGLGALDRAVPVATLTALPRRELTADFHCVSGWSATNLHWEGVPFAAFFAEIVAPLIHPRIAITHLVFEGLDGHRSIVTIEDALDDEVMIADRLDGVPLDADHGAPARLVSPRQYGFISTKHLCRIELHTAEPPRRYHSSRLIRASMALAQPHPRARVSEEERHRYLPAGVLRPLYTRLIPILRSLGKRGARRPS